MEDSFNNYRLQKERKIMAQENIRHFSGREQRNPILPSFVSEITQGISYNHSIRRKDEILTNRFFVQQAHQQFSGSAGASPSRLTS
jgi:hypothetical protein